MYRLTRNVHLCLGVGFTLVWLMYSLSSVQMAHPDWFPMEPRTSETTVPLTAGAAPDAPTLLHELVAAGAVRGDPRNPREAGDTLIVDVVRPGTVHEVRYVRGAASAVVETRVGGFMNMLNRLHHFAGFHHVWGPLDLWGALVALASLGLFALGLSGIYLWYRSIEERRLGAVLLASNLIVGIVLIILLRAAA